MGKVSGMLFRRQGPPVSVSLTPHGDAGDGVPTAFEVHGLGAPLQHDEVVVVQCQGGGLFKCRMVGDSHRCTVLSTRADSDVESCWADDAT
jgi:hypothetical protein